MTLVYVSSTASVKVSSTLPGDCEMTSFAGGSELPSVAWALALARKPAVIRMAIAQAISRRHRLGLPRFIPDPGPVRDRAPVRRASRISDASDEPPTTLRKLRGRPKYRLRHFCPMHRN